MICYPCRMNFHNQCDNKQPFHGGGNWCDCQHKNREVWDGPQGSDDRDDEREQA